MTDLQVGWACDVGFKRRGRENQDSVGVVTPGPGENFSPLFIVADGMGGYQGGKRASEIVVDTFSRMIRSRRFLDKPRQELDQMVEAAHREIVKTGKKEKMPEMGSTLVAAILQQDRLSVVSVGDARAYMITGQEIIQISEDQSWVAEQVRKGLLSSEEARTHPRKNQVSMSISARRNSVEANYQEYHFHQNEKLLLCSDGLWGMVPESLIKSVVLQLDVQKAADKLVDLANANHGRDNISVIIVSRSGAATSVDEGLDDTLPGI